jgi:hypothetical protein
MQDRLVYFDELIGGVQISRSDFVDEHLNLLNILRKGSKSARRREAKDQAKELANVLSGAGGSNSKPSVPPSHSYHARQIKSRFQDILGDPEWNTIRNQGMKDHVWTVRSQPIYEYGIEHGMKVKAIDKLLEEAKKEMDPGDMEGGGNTCAKPPCEPRISPGTTHRPKTQKEIDAIIEEHAEPGVLVWIREHLVQIMGELLRDPEYNFDTLDAVDRQRVFEGQALKIFERGYELGLPLSFISRMARKIRIELEADIEPAELAETEDIIPPPPSYPPPAENRQQHAISSALRK